MTGRLYTVPYTGTIANSGGNADLLECLPAANKICKLAGYCLGQISEVGDAAEEGLQLNIQRMTATVTSGSGGSAVTPVPVRTTPGNTAASFTSECNNATVATTSGTATILEYIGWNIRQTPYPYFYPNEDFYPEVINAEGLFMRMDTTPADDFTGNFVFWILEA